MCPKLRARVLNTSDLFLDKIWNIWGQTSTNRLCSSGPLLSDGQVAQGCKEKEEWANERVRKEEGRVPPMKAATCKHLGHCVVPTP